MGLVVPKGGPQVEDLEGFRSGLELVEVESDDRGGELGAKGELPTAFVPEDVHLLDDAGSRLRDEEFCLLERRRGHLAIAKPPGHTHEGGLDVTAAHHFFRGKIPGPPRPFEHRQVPGVGVLKLCRGHTFWPSSNPK